MDSLNRKRRQTRSTRHTAVMEALEPRVLLSYTFASIASFKNSQNGIAPMGLVMDNAGNLFGVTHAGGAHGYGAIFEIPSQNVGSPALVGNSNSTVSSIITLASFSGANGISPRGGLVIDANGNLFGTTVGGGAFNKGTIFKLAAGASTITTLASFNGSNGAYPFAGLVSDASGNLFGTTIGISASDNPSTVFELANGSSTITLLASFKSGDKLTGTLAINSSGTIFGTTSSGGTNSKGTIFQIAGSAHTLSTIASFNGTNGSGPDGGLLLDPQGNLIGLTASGGSNNAGTLFKLSATSSTITTLASFGGSKGARPIGNLLMDNDGNLFGVTATGGSKGVGTIFERAAGTSNTITTLFSFSNNSTGYNPTGPLVMDSFGNFWGTTFLGGKNDCGSIFRLHDNSVVFAPQPTPAGQVLTLATSAPHLVITQQPAKVGSGKAFTLVIKLEDALGKVVSSSARLTLSLATGPQGGTLTGSLKVSFVKGVAKISNLALKGIGTYTIRVLSESLPALSGPIQVT